MTTPWMNADLVRDLIQAGHFFFDRGWVPATSGNFSARSPGSDTPIIMTVSGRHKGYLTEDDFIAVDLQGRPQVAGKKPSAETALHLALYRRDPTIGAVLHTHSVAATVLSRCDHEALHLTDYEVLKAFPGIDSHTGSVMIPIFANDQDMPRLAAVVDHYFDQYPNTHGYLIAGHGFYTWGNTIADACRHIEAFEFLFECEILMRRLSSRRSP